MVSYSFKIITENKKDNGLYNLFVDTIIDQDVPRFKQVVMEGEEGRLDLFCQRIYNNANYVEELMVINNILNPFSIVAGQELEIVNISDLTLFRQPELSDENSESVANPKSKNTRKDPKREKGVPPTIKPLNFQQVLVNKTSKTIRINPKLL